ncbi:MAG TPA: AsmA family protein, partial [Saprospiraceae bacterium]
MYREKILKALKVFVIIFLVMAISILVILNWKSDLIIDKVMASVQQELVDSLRYEEATLDLFSHFPSTSIQIHNLYLGSEKHPLIRGGDIDIIIGLIPLLKGNILINQLKVTGATIHIENKNGRWSYDILKEKETVASEESQDTTFSTQIKELQLEHTTLLYDDGEGLRFAIDISDGHLEGGLENEILDLSIDLTSVITSLTMDDYQLKESFATNFTGDYTFDLTSGLQKWKDWKIENDAIHLSANGNILRAEDHEMVDIIIDWNKADLESIKKWLPESMKKTWNQYSFSGDIEG